MSKALFAYDAWNTVTFAAGEVREPQRNLPRALVAGTVTTTLATLAACAAYLYVLPLDRMAAVTENRVAADVASAILGPAGVTAVSLAILVSTFGCANGLILSGARVLFAMASDGVFFQAAGRVDARHQTPSGALALQGAWSVVLALSGTYDRLLTYVTFASLGFNALTVVALFVLRRTRADAARPYRTWGYPVTPALYLAGALFFLALHLRGRPARRVRRARARRPRVARLRHLYASGARPGDRLSVAIMAENTAQDGVTRHAPARGRGAARASRVVLRASARTG